jgi:N-dimethylarginine dimethylaminohydrolase
MTIPPFTRSFTQQEPIPEDAIAAAIEVMRSGRLHRYNTAPGEEEASNALRIPPTGEGDRRLLMPLGFEGTLATVREAGFSVRPVDISQFALAEAGLTCMSVLLGARW